MNSGPQNTSALKVGNYAPDFTVDTDDGKQITLSELRGKNVVLYFYPKDDTPGCTQEAKDFADLMDDFERNNTVILGISKDSIESHAKFKAKCGLPFTLISDQNSTVCEAYDTWVEKNNYGKKYMGIQRDTFLITKRGGINRIWRRVSVNGHAREVLDAVIELESK